MRATYTVPESREWKRARQAAFVQDSLAVFTQRQVNLLSFEEVSRKLHLSNVQYLDLQVVPLDWIVGSVDRYEDFTATFLPRQDCLKDRWQRIEQMVVTGRELPPIELYKVGQAYFVRDGNHRVSVARRYRVPSIRAYVWECETDLPLQPGADVNDLLCKTAHSAFLNQTGLCHLCPGLDIKFTQPDGYADLLAEIQVFQQNVSKIDEREVPFPEAVTLWAEMCYAPIVEIMQRRHMLQDFPGRTATDLYIWLCRHQEELKAHYQRSVLVDEAAGDLARRFSGRLFPAGWARKVADSVTEFARGRVPGQWRTRRQVGRQGRLAYTPPSTQTRGRHRRRGG